MRTGAKPELSSLTVLLVVAVVVVVVVVVGKITVWLQSPHHHPLSSLDLLGDMEAARAEREDESHAVLDKPSVESEVQPQAPAQASESSAPHDAPENKDDIPGFVEHLPAYPLIVSIMGRVCQEECVTIDGAIFMGRPADVQKPLASMAYLQENLTVPVVDFRKDAIIDELKDTPEKDCMQRRSTYFADCSVPSLC